jgi:hypothetical protein
MVYEEFQYIVVLLLKKRKEKALSCENISFILNDQTSHSFDVKMKNINIPVKVELDSYYKEYCNQEKTIPQIVEDLADSLLRHRKDYFVSEAIDCMYDFNDVKDRIVAGIIPQEEVKEDMVTEPYLDFTVAYYAYFSNADTEEKFFMALRTSHLQFWSVSEEVIRKAAIVNTKRLLPSFYMPLCNVISKNVCPSDMELEMISKVQKKLTPKQQVYIITNEELLFGASDFITKDSIKRLAGYVGSDLYITLFSPHVLLAVSVNAKDNFKAVTEGIRCVKDLFTENVYRYCKDTDSIEREKSRL